MQYAVTMDVRLPHDLDPEAKQELLAREKEYSQRLQREGYWPHIWRLSGRYSNLSILDVSGNDELHEILGGLPLFPYMEISVTPLSKHPSDIR